MTTIKDILNFFESFAPAETAMDFDNCGLLVGDKGTPVTKALVTLDITADVVSDYQPPPRYFSADKAYEYALCPLPSCKVGNCRGLHAHKP